MTKRYKLLKDLPDSKPGDIYIWNDSHKAYYKDGNVLDSYWMKESVENNPDWFQEIKEPERIEVKDFYRSVVTECEVYCLETHGVIPPDKFPAIKQIIQNFLNANPSTVYTQEQLNEERYKAFNAAREKSDMDIGRVEYNDGDWSFVYNDIYPTFQDYLSSLKK